MPDTFNSFVIEVHVSQLDFLRVKRIEVNGEPMVLGGYFNFPGVKVHDRLITAMMAEFQFERFAAERQTKHLMSETNPEDRQFAH